MLSKSEGVAVNRWWAVGGPRVGLVTCTVLWLARFISRQRSDDLCLTGLPSICSAREGNTDPELEGFLRHKLHVGKAQGSFSGTAEIFMIDHVHHLLLCPSW